MQLIFYKKANHPSLKIYGFQSYNRAGSKKIIRIFHMNNFGPSSQMRGNLNIQSGSPMILFHQLGVHIISIFIFKK